MSFEMFSPELKKLIKAKGFLEPTLVQKMGIPEILNGHDLLIIAPTGFGKTETVMLPMFDIINKRKLKPVSVLYISPLRSLSRDLLDRLFWWGDKLGIDISVRHGDTTQTERAMQRESPSHVLITTPETLQAILTGKKLRDALKNIKHVVIDEVHELCSNKRGVQLSVALERLKELCGDFQRIGLSATVGSPKLIANFISSKTKIINAEAVKKFEIRVELPEVNKEYEEIADKLFIGKETVARLMRIKDLIQKHSSVLIFTNTRQTAEVLSSRFRSIDSNIKQDVHHSSLSRESRIKTEQKFKSQELKSIIATSSLELGIDIGSIDLVIQYLSPRQVLRIIQRVGRSGHTAKEKSKGIIITGDEDVFESAVIAKFATQKMLEPVKIPRLSYDVLATQIAGIAIENYEIEGEDVYKIIKRSFPYHGLTKEEFYETLKFMAELRIIWLNPSGSDFKIKRSKKCWEYYFRNLSTIPDTSRYRVLSIVQNEPIGFLDEAFVAEHCEPEKKFVCNGRAWKVITVEDDKVLVEPINDIESAIPAWEGELIPVPFAVAQGVAELMEFISKNIDKPDIIDTIKNYYPVDSNSAQKMVEIVREHLKDHTLPTQNKFLIENFKDFLIIHSPCGTLINETIGKYLSAEITNNTGVSVTMKVDPYRIILQTLESKEAVTKLLCNAESVEDVLRNSLERSTLFKWRFVHVAKRFGVLSYKVDFDKISLTKIIGQYRGTLLYEEVMKELFLEKLDIEGALKILAGIKDGKIKLKLENGLSHLGRAGLLYQFGEVIKPKRAEGEIFNAFKNRLLNTSIRFVCTNCCSYNTIREVKDVDEHPACKKCGSGMLAVCRHYDTSASNILMKYKLKKKLNKEEQKKIKELLRSASLLMTYGRRFVLTVAGRGVGTETAARILACLQPDEETLLKDIFAAEKNYLRTKKYWKA